MSELEVADGKGGDGCNGGDAVAWILCGRPDKRGLSSVVGGGYPRRLHKMWSTRISTALENRGNARGRKSGEESSKCTHRRTHVYLHRVTAQTYTTCSISIITRCITYGLFMDAFNGRRGQRLGEMERVGSTRCTMLRGPGLSQ